MRVAESPHIDWYVAPGVGIPPEVIAAAQRGVPIVVHLRPGAPIDGWVAELLEECAAVVRYGT